VRPRGRSRAAPPGGRCGRPVSPGGLPWLRRRALHPPGARPPARPGRARAAPGRRARGRRGGGPRARAAPWRAGSACACSGRRPGRPRRADGEPARPGPLSHRSRLCSLGPLFLQLGAHSRTIVGGRGMSGRFGRAVVVVGWMVAVAACNPLDRFRPTSVNVPPQPLADDDDQLAWAEHEPWVVVVRKSCRTLDVYNYGARVRSFPTVFGLNGSGSKLYEGDRRTPSGLYMIVDKRAHPRWRQLLLLNYPNAHDLQRYWLAMEGGGLPRRGDGYVGAGGAVGIHGTDKPGLKHRGVDGSGGAIRWSTPAAKPWVGRGRWAPVSR